jgi:hypothetical protein
VGLTRGFLLSLLIYAQHELGQEYKMPITQTLRIAIADCLEMFPGIETLEGRKELITQADLDAELAKRITYGGSVHSFCALLVSDLEEYGTLEDGYHPLQAIVDAVRESVDGEERRECDVVLTDLRLQLALAGAGELIRTRWYVLLSGFAFCAILLVAVGYVLPVAGQPVLGPTPSEMPKAVVAEAFTPTPIKMVMANTVGQTSEPLLASPVPAITETPPLTSAPDVTGAVVEQPSRTTTVEPATSTLISAASTVVPTSTPMAGAAMPTIEPPPTMTLLPTQTLAPGAAVLAVLSPSAEPTSMPTSTIPPSPTTASRPRLTRTSSPTVAPVDGKLVVIKLDAPEVAFYDIKGNYTLSGLAIQCLDASSVALVDQQGFPVLVPLQGAEGVYALPEGTAKVLLWVDSKVYGDWWDRFVTQAESIREQEIIVLRVLERSGPQPEKTLPNRRWKTPLSTGLGQ